MKSLAPGFAALLSATKSLLEKPPRADESPAERAAQVRALARGLEAHGVDGLSVIRFGMSELFVGPVLGSVVLSAFLERRMEPADWKLPIDIEGWRDALGLAAPTRDDDLGAMLEHTAAVLEGWVAEAPLELLVDLAPATRHELAAWSGRVDARTRSVRQSYTWLVERALEESLDQWSTKSLKLEYRHTVLGEPPTVGSTALADVGVDPDRLAHCLATRILREESDQERSQWSALVSAVQQQAKMLLRQKRHTEAAALFEFLVNQSPGDANLHNNLGFCLIVTRPEVAAEHLRDAHRLGFGHGSLLNYNRACCATTEALKRESLFEANRHWLDSLEPAPIAAFIWRRIDDSLVPAETLDVRLDLATICADLACELGELDRAKVWRERVRELSIPADRDESDGLVTPELNPPWAAPPAH